MGLKAAVTSAPRKPVTCCSKASILIDLIAKDLDPALVKDYKAMELEWSSTDKLYCADKKCSAFIPPNKINRDKEGVCEKCGMHTCGRCRAEAHPGTYSLTLNMEPLTTMLIMFS